MKVPMNQTVPIRSKNPVNSSKERLEEGNDHLNHTTPTRPMSSTTHNKSQKVRPKQINK